MTPLPNRASDAGPDNTPEEPMTWDELAYTAEEELRDARRTYRDDISQQRALRLAHLHQAQHNIQQAIAALEMPAREAPAEPEHDDSVKCCPDCERPNQFGELCSNCEAERNLNHEAIWCE